MKKFEKKQETYHAFLTELGIIVKNLTLRSLSGNEKAPYENISSLEELIIQFGYLRIHMDDEKFLYVIKNTTEIISVYKQAKLSENYRQDILFDNKRKSNAVNQGFMNYHLGLL